MLFEDKITKQEVEHLARVIAVLARNVERLDATRRLTALNLVFKVAIARDARGVILPPMQDLEPDLSRMSDLPRSSRLSVK